MFDTVGVTLQAGLLEERDVGVLNAAVTLLLGIVSRNYEGGPSFDRQGWPCINASAPKC